MVGKTISAVAPGKLMLLGEHSVVYGRKCLVTAVDAPVKATIGNSNEFSLDLQDSKFNGKFSIESEEYPKEMSFAAQAVKNFHLKFGLKDPVRISTKSLITSEKKVGLGSSSAVTVAIIKALSRHFNTTLTEHELFELAYKTVLDVQKVGSGFDVAAASFGGTIYYSIGKPVPVKCHGLKLIIGYTGTPASTPEIVKKVAESMKEQPDYYDGLFDEIDRLVKLAKPAIEEGDWEKLGILMNNNQEILRQFKSPSEEYGVSSEILEKLISAALDAGAYGAKLSGAGVGDCMISVAPEEKRVDVEKAIEAAGGRVIKADTNVSGASITSDEP